MICVGVLEIVMAVMALSSRFQKPVIRADARAFPISTPASPPVMRSGPSASFALVSVLPALKLR